MVPGGLYGRHYSPWTLYKIYHSVRQTEKLKTMGIKGALRLVKKAPEEVKEV